MKTTITFQGQTVELVKRVSEKAKTGKQRYEAGRDAAGRLFFKGKTGRWSLAHDTIELATSILKNA